MKKTGIKLLRILRNVLLVLVGIVVLFFLVRFVGQKVNDAVPTGGVNESQYVEINGTKQWINIYGEDINNPVLLYLHGGPGSATSPYDYAFTRKWADVYTVVTWDQRNCGKSYDASQNGIALTYDLMMDDGLDMTKYLLGHLGKEKITLLGHSWGTYLGSNLVLTYPELYDCYIGTGQLVDMNQNEVAFREVAAEWVGDDAEGLDSLELLTPEQLTKEHLVTRNMLMEKYGYGMIAGGTDYNMPLTCIFNPYDSIGDFVNYMGSDYSVYMDFILSDEFSKFSLLGKTEYAVPYFNINGDRDYQTNYELAQEYFDQVKAPYKQMFIMEGSTHGLLESHSEDFSKILHEIAEEREKWGEIADQQEM